MGTRSRIGLTIGDQIISVYCHYDGYIEHNGRILIEHYSNKELLEELINGGDMSSLRSEHFWDSEPLKKVVHHPDGSTKVEYVKDADGDCIYSPVKSEPSPIYYSERGEDAPPKLTSLEEFLSGNCGEEWAYLFTVGKGWRCWEIGWSETPTKEVDLYRHDALSCVTS
tara:strand:+ start:79 stop:582 length:504 start_codon:yes stop_codon:yes gene_type:complete